MEGDGGNGFDTEVEDVAAKNTHNVVLVTLWVVASEWQSEIYSLGDQIFQKKMKDYKKK